jgi:hypothetical protein
MKLGPKILKDETGQESTAQEGDGERMVTIPFTGLVGTESGNLFNKPLEVYSPGNEILNELDDDEVTEENMQIIQQRIQARVEELKSRNEWEGDSFGKNPLEGIPDYQVMIDQVKSVKPFETLDELALDYSLMLATTAIMTILVFVFQAGLDEAITLFLQTDFDSDFLETIFKSTST